MDLRKDRELANTRRKLARLEALYAADEKETGGDEELRRMEMESLKRDINQFKEEIARIECGLPARRPATELRNERELVNTRAKLARLQAHYDSRRREPVEDEKLRELSLRSVQRTINQLKEEIARYEAHHPRVRQAG